MNNPFVKLGKLMSEPVYQSLSLLPNPISVEELSKRYKLRLDEQLDSFNKERNELESNIAELEQKNNILSLLLDEKFGKRVNNKTQHMNSEKIQLNKTIILYLISKKEQIIKAIQQTTVYKNKNENENKLKFNV